MSVEIRVDVRRVIAALALGASMCGSGQPGTTRYVNLEPNAEGKRGALPFWVSSESLQRCFQQGFDRLDEGAKAKEAFTGGACADGRIGNLAHGTAVEALGSSPECKNLTKVRVLEGEHKDKVGCVPPETLSPERKP